MIKPTSMSALKTCFFMGGTILPLVASIDDAQEALLRNVAEQAIKLHCCLLQL
jgi:hypothetical protein